MTGRQSIKGFTLLECLIVLIVFSVVVLMAVPARLRERVYSVSEIIERLSFEQWLAVEENDYHECDIKGEDYSIRFNRRGSVMHAETVYLHAGKIIVSLGTGRFYEKP